jgi:hypothetical protein
MGRQSKQRNHRLGLRTRGSAKSAPALFCSIVIFQLIAGLPTANAGEWSSEIKSTEPSAKLCDALTARLNHMSDRCAADALETYPEFSSPPWRSLDPKRYVELIAELRAYIAGGPLLYFSKPINLEPFREGVKTFIAQGGELQVWTTHLLSNFGDKTEATNTSGDQTVIMLTTKVGAADPHADCPGKSTKGWVRSTFIVLPDLSGPDPRVSQGTAAVLRDHWPVIYGDQVLLIGGVGLSYSNSKLVSGNVDIFQDVPGGGLEGGYCDLKLTKPRTLSRGK